MDWARAKNILILIFVLLNLFLCTMLLKLFYADNISDETIDNTNKVLNERGIVVNCDIPIYNKQMGTLSSSDAQLNKKLIIKAFLGEEKYTEENLYTRVIADSGDKELIINKKNTFTYKNKNPQEGFDLKKDSRKLQKYLEKLFKGFNVPLSNFYIDKTIDLSKDEKEYIFRQKKDKFWLYSNYINVTVSDKGITYLKYNYRNTGKITNGKKIIPVYQVLLRNFIQDDDMVINKIDIGFGEHFIEEHTKVLDDIPVWRITIEKGRKTEERYFKVYNGEEVKLNVK